MTIRSATYIGTVALLSQLLLAHGCGSNNPSTIAAAGDDRARRTPRLARRAQARRSGGRHGWHAERRHGRVQRARWPPRRPVAQAAQRARQTPRRPGHGRRQPVRRPLRRRVALPPLRRPPAAVAAQALPGLSNPLCSTPAHGCGVPFQPRLSSAPTAIRSFATGTCGPKSVGFKSGNLLGRNLPGAVRLLLPHGNRLLLLQDTVSCRSVLSYYRAASQPTLLGGRLRALQRQWWLQRLERGRQDRLLRLPDDKCGTPGKWTCASTTAWPCPAGPGLLRESNFNQHPAARSSIRHHPMAKQQPWPNVSQASHKLVAWCPRCSLAALSGCLAGPMMTLPAIETVCGTADPADLAGGRPVALAIRTCQRNRSFRLTPVKP